MRSRCCGPKGGSGGGGGGKGGGEPGGGGEGGGGYGGGGEGDGDGAGLVHRQYSDWPCQHSLGSSVVQPLSCTQPGQQP